MECVEGISLKVRVSGIKFRIALGGIAQLVERLVRNEKVWGSTPHTSTKDFAPVTSPKIDRGISGGYQGDVHRFLPRHFPLAILLAALFLTTTKAVAETNYWSGLSSRQREILNSGETLILEEDLPGNPWPRFIVYQLVKATPAQVAAVFWDLRLDPKYVPNCLSVTILAKPSPHVIDGEYTLKMPLFLPDEVYVSRNTLHRRTPEDYEISWIVLRSRYTKSCSGNLSLQKHEKGTLLRYSNQVEPGSRIAGIMKNNAGHQVVASVKALVSQVAREMERPSDPLEKQMKALEESLGSPVER